MRNVRALSVGGLVVAGAAAVGIPLALSEPTRSQSFFRERLLADARTSSSIKRMLRDDSGFVDRSIAFRDLTGDDRDDAVVRVLSGGAAGAVAVYVFSTHGADELRAVHRSQRLLRASTHVRDGVLSFRSAEYAAGDELCCPSRVVETELEWVRRERRFAVAARREVPPPTAPAPAP